MAANEDPREPVILDDVKIRCVALLGDGFSALSAHDLAEFELALRTDDPVELEAIYERWRNGGLDKAPGEPFGLSEHE